MKTSWAENLYDYEGDKYDDCILLFCDDNVILKFKHIEELDEFANSVKRMVNEIKEISDD
jgi:hypothetical protein